MEAALVQLPDTRVVEMTYDPMVVYEQLQLEYHDSATLLSDQPEPIQRVLLLQSEVDASPNKLPRMSKGTNVLYQAHPGEIQGVQIARTMMIRVLFEYCEGRDAATMEGVVKHGCQAYAMNVPPPVGEAFASMNGDGEEKNKVEESLQRCFTFVAAVVTRAKNRIELLNQATKAERGLGQGASRHDARSSSLDLLQTAAARLTTALNELMFTAERFVVALGSSQLKLLTGMGMHSCNMNVTGMGMQEEVDDIVMMLAERPDSPSQFIDANSGSQLRDVRYRLLLERVEAPPGMRLQTN
jgi:hypothetical protein